MENKKAMLVILLIMISVITFAQRTKLISTDTCVNMDSVIRIVKNPNGFFQVNISKISGTLQGMVYAQTKSGRNHYNNVDSFAVVNVDQQVKMFTGLVIDRFVYKSTFVSVSVIKISQRQ